MSHFIRTAVVGAENVKQIYLGTEVPVHRCLKLQT